MYIDPVCHTGRPSDQRIPQEEAVYDKLEELGIEFARVDHDHADTMEELPENRVHPGSQDLQKSVPL